MKLRELLEELLEELNKEYSHEQPNKTMIYQVM